MRPLRNCRVKRARSRRLLMALASRLCMLLRRAAAGAAGLLLLFLRAGIALVAMLPGLDMLLVGAPCWLRSSCRLLPLCELLLLMEPPAEVEKERTTAAATASASLGHRVPAPRRSARG